MARMLAKDGLPCPQCGSEDTRMQERDHLHEMKCSDCHHEFDAPDEAVVDETVQPRWPLVHELEHSQQTEHGRHEHALFHAVRCLTTIEAEPAMLRDIEVRKRVVKTLDKIEAALAQSGGVHTLGQMGLAEDEAA